MRELLRDLARWRKQGKAVALARVVDLEGSGPRDPGAAMAVSGDGEVIGSVSGGCVEGAVVTEALEVLASGEPRLVTFGYSDDDAFAVGLTCGGTVHLFIEPLDWMDALQAAVRDHQPAMLVTVVDGPGTGDKLLLIEGEPPVGQLADPDRRGALDEQQRVAGTGAVDNGGQHRRALLSDRRFQLRHPRERLDEEVDGAATGEADREGVVVAVAERHEPTVAGRQHVERLADHRALDAAARHRADHLAVATHGHRGARIARTRPLEVDHPGPGHRLSLLLPTGQVAQEIPHRAITSASSSSDARE